MKAITGIGGFVAAAAIGVATGLLLAPASGKKTRKKMLRGSLRLKDDVVDYVDDALDSLRDQFNHKIDQLALRGKETINHMSEKVKVP